MPTEQHPGLPAGRQAKPAIQDKKTEKTWVKITTAAATPVACNQAAVIALRSHLCATRRPLRPPPPRRRPPPPSVPSHPGEAPAAAAAAAAAATAAAVATAVGRGSRGVMVDRCAGKASLVAAATPAEAVTAAAVVAVAATTTGSRQGPSLGGDGSRHRRACTADGGA